MFALKRLQIRIITALGKMYGISYDIRVHGVPYMK